MDGEHLRIDKWLWAARFFKTRSLAAKALDDGRVRVNGEGAKPSRAVKVGDELAIRVGEFEWVVEVKALGRQRGPALCGMRGQPRPAHGGNGATQDCAASGRGREGAPD